MDLRDREKAMTGQFTGETGSTTHADTDPAYLPSVPSNPQDSGNQNCGRYRHADGLADSGVQVVDRPGVAGGVRVARHGVPAEERAVQDKTPTRATCRGLRYAGGEGVYSIPCMAGPRVP